MASTSSRVQKKHAAVDLHVMFDHFIFATSGHSIRESSGHSC